MGIADEAHQRTSWFGVGPWINSPDEQFCRFFDDADVPEFLSRANNRLSDEQALHLTKLNVMMRKLSDNTLDIIKPEDLIDDPRWQEIRKQASITLDAMSEND